MLEFGLTGVALVAKWFQQHGVAFVVGLLLGSFGTAATFGCKLIQMRRDGVL